jgi:hypothetical protein
VENPAAVVAPEDGEQIYEVFASGVNFTDTHHSLS